MIAIAFTVGLVAAFPVGIVYANFRSIFTMHNGNDSPSRLSIPHDQIDRLRQLERMHLQDAAKRKVTQYNSKKQGRLPNRISPDALAESSPPFPRSNMLMVFAVTAGVVVGFVLGFAYATYFHFN